MPNIYYPTSEKIIEFNLLALNIIKVKKADRPEVLSYEKIRKTTEECKDKKGDVHDKAVVLLKGLIQKHPFASVNRRTAFIVTKYFLVNNKKSFKIKDIPEQSRIMLGIRGQYYPDKEIKGWIKNGKIKKFKR
jgi:prophage maintenance system killer protein